jgi:hypothetical protein
MTEFVLILLMTAGGYGNPAATSVLFPTQAACERAKAAALEEFSTWSNKARAVCVPRGTP